MPSMNEENNEDIFDINFIASTVEVSDELMSWRSCGTCLCME